MPGPTFTSCWGTKQVTHACSLFRSPMRIPFSQPKLLRQGSGGPVRRSPDRPSPAYRMSSLSMKRPLGLPKWVQM